MEAACFPNKPLLFSFFLFFFETGGSRQPYEHARHGGSVLFARYLPLYHYCMYVLLHMCCLAGKKEGKRKKKKQ
jgi:hypothetical protein